jgi:hypothetical protein
MGVPVVLEPKTTILWKCLYLPVSLKDSPGLDGAHETNRRGGEENPVHGQNTTVNVGKIRDFRPLHVWTKTFGYCWSTHFKVLAVLFLGEVCSAFLPSKKACWAHQFRHFGVRQQYPFVLLLTLDRESTDRCFLYACYGNPMKPISASWIIAT